MNINDTSDQRLDRGLRAIGEHLPEPAPSPDTCARLTRLIEGADVPDAPAPELTSRWGQRAHRAMGLIAAAMVLAGMAWLVVSTPRVGSDPSLNTGDASAGAARTLVNFTHRKCEVSKRMEPRFRALAGQCRKAGVSVKQVDMTAWAPGQEREEIQKLGLGCVLSECQMPMLSGMTLVFDDEGHILAQARGDEPLDEVQRALGDSPTPSP